MASAVRTEGGVKKDLKVEGRVQQSSREHGKKSDELVGKKEIYFKGR